MGNQSAAVPIRPPPTEELALECAEQRNQGCVADDIELDDERESDADCCVVVMWGLGLCVLRGCT